MIKGLSGATIWSEDVGNLLPFYRDTLGLKVAQQTPGFVVLGDGNGTYLGLGTHSEVKGMASDPYRHMVGLDSDDLDADFQRLEAVSAARGRRSGVHRAADTVRRPSHRDAAGPRGEHRPAVPASELGE